MRNHISTKLILESFCVQAMWARALSCWRQTPFVSIPILLFWMTLQNLIKISQYKAEFMVVLVGINLIKRTPFLSPKTLAITFQIDWVTLNFFFFGEWECLHSNDCYLNSGIKIISSHLITRESKKASLSSSAYRAKYSDGAKFTLSIHGTIAVVNVEQFIVNAC